MNKILYIHVPKCGGTSISRAIKEAYFFSKIFYRKKGIVSIYGGASRRSAEIVNESIGSHRIKLAMYSLSVPHNNVLLGHIPYDNKFYENFYENWNFVTLLRDPVERWYSEFYYVQKTSPDKFKKMSVPTEEYLNSKPAKLFATNYVRFFSSIPELYDFTDIKDFDIENIDWDFAVKQAILNLKKFSVVGFLDDLGSFKKSFKKSFDRRLRIGHNNKNNRNTNYREDIPEEIHNKVIRLCKEDIQIYNTIKQNFSEKI